MIDEKTGGATAATKLLPEQPIAASSPAPAPKAPPAPPPAPKVRDVNDWAARKGTRPHQVAGAIAHANWPTVDGVRRLVTESDFDAAVKAAGTLPLS